MKTGMEITRNSTALKSPQREQKRRRWRDLKVTSSRFICVNTWHFEIIAACKLKNRGSPLFASNHVIETDSKESCS